MEEFKKEQLIKEKSEIEKIFNLIIDKLTR